MSFLKILYSIFLPPSLPMHSLIKLGAGIDGMGGWVCKNLSTSSFLQFKLLPSDRQLVHHEFILHRCASDQRLLEIPASCHRISDDNPA